MIQITNKKKCCGCLACVQKCPSRCINIYEDIEGFIYPIVDKEKCIDCGLCEKVCIEKSTKIAKNPLEIYAASNINEEIKKQSSSGGIFSSLANVIIKEKGVVFGAKFNKSWSVEHDYVESEQNIASLRGSKYVQSNIGDSYRKVEERLKEGRLVLFSGTPCQIGGLYMFLGGHKYQNLLTVDFICHGVPSPKVWRMYLNENYNIENIRKIYFRDKIQGWKNFSMSVTENIGDKTKVKSTIFYEDIFMKGFLANLYLRPSCSDCPTKCLKSESDITIGDFWGYQMKSSLKDDDSGVSLVSVNTELGKQFFDQIQNQIYSVEYDVKTAFLKNISFFMSVKPHPNRAKFFKNIVKNKRTINELIEKSIKPTMVMRMERIYKKIKMMKKRYLK